MAIRAGALVDSPQSQKSRKTRLGGPVSGRHLGWMHRVAGLYRTQFGHCPEQLDTIIAQLQLSFEDPSELPPANHRLKP